jgi:hypothetical protein
MSVIAGEAVASLRTLDDKQVLQQCMTTLRELFKEQVRETLRGRRDTLAVNVLFRVGRMEALCIIAIEGSHSSGPCCSSFQDLSQELVFAC